MNNNNLDYWLQSLGFNEEACATINAESSASSEVLPIITTDSTSSTVEPVTQELSAGDFNEILSDLGFEETPEAEAVEITEEGGRSRNEVVNTEEALEAVQSVNDDDYPDNNPDIYDESAQEPLLPPNSPTLLIDDSTSRFSGTEWFEEMQKQRIIIAGCGGIGSNLIFQIARMHPETMVLYDDDTVEQANMSGQLFNRDDVGHYKVDAIASMINNYTSITNVYANPTRFDSNSSGGNIMMCGFDSMSARKNFFDKWCNHLHDIPAAERKKCLFLDGRLSIDTLQVLCLTGDDVNNIERYSKQCLFSDSEADATICSMKQTTYMACMIGSLMTNLFVNFVANLLNPAIPYDLPFFIEYDAQNMIFKTEY